MDFKGIILTEISQTQKDKYCMIPLNEMFRIAKFIDTENRIVAARDCEKEDLGIYCLMDMEYQFAVMKKF